MSIFISERERVANTDSCFLGKQLTDFGYWWVRINTKQPKIRVTEIWGGERG